MTELYQVLDYISLIFTFVVLVSCLTGAIAAKDRINKKLFAYASLSFISSFVLYVYMKANGIENSFYYGLINVSLALGFLGFFIFWVRFNWTAVKKRINNSQKTIAKD